MADASIVWIDLVLARWARWRLNCGTRQSVTSSVWRYTGGGKGDRIADGFDIDEQSARVDFLIRSLPKFERMVVVTHYCGNGRMADKAALVGLNSRQAFADWLDKARRTLADLVARSDALQKTIDSGGAIH